MKSKNNKKKISNHQNYLQNIFFVLLKLQKMLINEQREKG